jgi:hypothetical protein
MRNFHVERFARLIAGESPIILRRQVNLVTHIMPFSAFDTAGRRPDLTGMNKAHGSAWPLSESSGADYRFNLDGWVMYDRGAGFVQYFRSGAVEGVNASWIGDDVVDQRSIQKGLVKFLKSTTENLRKFGLEGPFVLWTALNGTKGKRLNRSTFDAIDAKEKVVDRDQIHFDPLQGESLEVTPVEFLKPLFDALWQSAGWERCLDDYDKT